MHKASSQQRIQTCIPHINKGKNRHDRYQYLPEETIYMFFRFRIHLCIHCTPQSVTELILSIIHYSCPLVYFLLQLSPVLHFFHIKSAKALPAIQPIPL